LSKRRKRAYVDYYSYIKSNEWFSKHQAWLSAVGDRCTMFPWVRVGSGHQYAIHHMNYKNLGDEKLGRDVVPLCRFAHEYIIHGILSGFKSAGKQQNYPNLPQRLVHFWCVQRRWFKGLIVLAICWKLIEGYFKLT